MQYQKRVGYGPSHTINYYNYNTKNNIFDSLVGIWKQDMSLCISLVVPVCQFLIIIMVIKNGGNCANDKTVLHSIHL